MSQNKQKYTPIIPKAEDWPIAQLNRQREPFIQAVIDKAMQTLLATYSTTDDLRAVLVKTVATERVRSQRKAWKVDPADEPAFWQQQEAALADGGNMAAILEAIINRYAHEIAGNFRMAHYQLGQRAITYTLTQMLNPLSLKRVTQPWRMQERLRERIHIMGEIDELRELAKIGTLLMVPTHFSHIDSMLMGWVTQTLGLPHFVYGAGLNLFNSRFFAYFLNNLGVYKVDRRKKNLPYLATLNSYSSLALQWGCHSLFYPGGTRSRSGALEQQLKLGLLGTAFEAQRCNYQAQGSDGRKLFVVPVVLSYNCVLEAPLLVNNYLASQGHARLGSSSTPPYKLLKLTNNFFTKNSTIFVSIGQPMDLLGNRVDGAGNSYDAQGGAVDTYAHFLEAENGGGAGSQQDNHTTTLSNAIVKAYYKANCVLISYLVAFAAFTCIKKQHAALDEKALLQLPPEKVRISYATLVETFTQLRVAILQLHEEGKLSVEPMLKEENIDWMLQHGLANLGLYHAQRPLLQNKAGEIVTQDLRTLFYYHNRLQGYGLEKQI